MATIRQRLNLGRALARIREDRGWSQDYVAQRLQWSRPTVGRIEAGITQRGLEANVRRLLDLYEVLPEQSDLLLALASGSSSPGWWEGYQDVGNVGYFALEDEASLIRSWQAQVIPGLLQIEDYARATFEIGNLKDQRDRLNRAVAARMTRRTLLGRDDPPQFHVVLGEAVIRQQVGGPDVMRAQLGYLSRMARRSNVTLQVIPFSAGAHPGLDGSMVILSFPGKDEPDVPFIEGQDGSTFLESENDITRVNSAWAHLAGTALDPDDSLVLIDRVSKET